MSEDGSLAAPGRRPAADDNKWKLELWDLKEKKRVANARRPWTNTVKPEMAFTRDGQRASPTALAGQEAEVLGREVREGNRVVPSRQRIHGAGVQRRRLAPWRPATTSGRGSDLVRREMKETPGRTILLTS